MKTFLKLLLVVVAVCLAAYAQGAENAQGFLRFGPRVFPPSRLPSPTELFGQFAAVMVNGTCNVDWDLLPNDDPDEHRSTVTLLLLINNLSITIHTKLLVINSSVN